VAGPRSGYSGIAVTPGRYPSKTSKKGLILAAKLIRHPDQLVLIGAPTSAGAAAAGVESGVAALRAVGIVERLRELGYEVNDAGDLPETHFAPDPESPRARNLKNVLAMLDVLRVRVEQSARAHALPIILGGDATISVALIAGLRRQAASLGLIHLGRYANLHTPMLTEDGLVEPMTVSHLVGQGAPEMVRFWKDPPLVREPDLVLFGLQEPDEIDQKRLGRLAVRRFPLERIRREGVRVTAETALERLRATSRDFVVHLSLNVFSPEEVPGCPRGAAGGLSVAEVAEALNCFASPASFAGFSISGYDSALDPEGRGAKAMAELLVGAMAARHTALLTPPEPEAAAEEGAETAETEKAEAAETQKAEPEKAEPEKAEAEKAEPEKAEPEGAEGEKPEPEKEQPAPTTAEAEPASGTAEKPEGSEEQPKDAPAEPSSPENEVSTTPSSGESDH
jgi:arginase